MRKEYLLTVEMCIGVPMYQENVDKAHASALEKFSMLTEEEKKQARKLPEKPHQIIDDNTTGVSSAISTIPFSPPPYPNNNCVLS